MEHQITQKQAITLGVPKTWNATKHYKVNKNNR